MKPRLMSSKKWTPFPPEFNAQIESVVREAFTPFLKDLQLRMEGRIYPEELLLRVGFWRQGELRQANFEASVPFKADKEKAIDKIYVAMDVLGNMMDDYFHYNPESEEELELPREWLEQRAQGHEIFVQFTTENSDLEAQANRLLGLEEGQTLVNEEDFEDGESHPPTLH